MSPLSLFFLLSLLSSPLLSSPLSLASAQTLEERRDCGEGGNCYAKPFDEWLANQECSSGFQEASSKLLCPYCTYVINRKAHYERTIDGKDVWKPYREAAERGEQADGTGYDMGIPALDTPGHNVQCLCNPETKYCGTGCFSAGTTYKGQRYMQSGDEEFGVGNVTCFTRKYTVAPGSSKTTPFIPIPEAEVDRICVTRGHAACVMNQKGEQVSLPVGYLEEGAVLCDQSVVSELADEYSSRLFISKQPLQPINNILSQFTMSLDDHRGQDSLVASSLVAPGNPYADIKLLERIPQYYMAMNVSAHKCTDSAHAVHAAAQACENFYCLREIAEAIDTDYFPGKLDPELKSWLVKFVYESFIPKLTKACFPTSLNDLYKTLTDPEKTCIEKLRFGKAPVAVSRVVGDGPIPPTTAPTASPTASDDGGGGGVSAATPSANVTATTSPTASSSPSVAVIAVIVLFVIAACILFMFIWFKKNEKEKIAPVEAQSVLVTAAKK